ncbi:MAG: hypothetical protein R3A51_22295, partial [Nannocystaceae bacterium]
ELPVTLVLGCQRRVRWVRFGAITAEDEAALKETVDELVAELTTPRCQRIVDRSPRVRAPTPAIVEPDVGPRCGDGRCDRGEQDRCPADCATCGDGSCERERGETPASCPQDCRRLATSTVCEGDECCGDGRCEPARGEDCRACAADCGCGSLERCQEFAGQWKCAVELLE